MILEADFLASNAIGIDSAQWCMTYADHPLCDLMPAEIDGRLYKAVGASMSPDTVIVNDEDDDVILAPPQGNGRHNTDFSQDSVPVRQLAT